MNQALLHYTPVHVLSRRLAAGEISAATLIDAFLDRIERHDHKLHAFVTVFGDDARRAAEAADLARGAGHAVGPLHGIPVAVKDIVDIEGRITTGGSAVWRERRSALTATLVQRMLAAGMIVLGKTHSVEFAMGSWGTNQHLGTPWNPWDSHAHRAPGGSSAGSAVSVSAGLAPWAIGTDTGGSVRIPSAWCGLTGLKTSFGRISCHGVLPLAASLDTPGPMCRDVTDAATLFELLQGRDPNDAATHGLPPVAVGAWRHGSLTGMRLGSLSPAEREPVDADVLAIYDAALEVLAARGAEVGPAVFPVGFTELGAEIGRIIGAEGYSVVGHLSDDPTAPVDDDVRPRIGIGRDMRSAEYLGVLARRREVTADYAQAWSGFDAIITPTAATVAPVVETIDQAGTAAQFTRPINYLARCALALPAGEGNGGLPVSMQVVCPRYDEQTALRIGRCYQEATRWHHRTPAGWD